MEIFQSRFATVDSWESWVSESHMLAFSLKISGFEFAAGAGKSVIWYVYLLAVLQKEPMAFV